MVTEPRNTVTDPHNTVTDPRNTVTEPRSTVTEPVEVTDGTTNDIRLIVVGGDGTLDTVIDSFPDLSALRLGVIPSGSGNDFSRAMGLKGSPAALMETILEDRVVREIDVGVVKYHDYQLPDTPLIDDSFRETHRFVVSSGIGFDAAVCAGVTRSRSKKVLNRLKLGQTSYLFGALREILHSGRERVSLDMTLDYGHTVHLDRTMFVAAMNTMYEGGGFMFGPDADPSDGMLDICVVGDISLFKFIFGLPFAKRGKHFRFKGLDHYLASTIDIKTGAHLYVHTDGETITRASNITFSVLPKALRMLD